VYLCQLDFPFFTLNSEYRKNVFESIHDIVFHGKGGYDWQTAYNMPIWLRRFTHKSISDFYAKEKEEYEKHSGKKKIDPNNPIKENLPNVNVPDFVSKLKSSKK